ncbi:hypothetical protein KSF_107140 [Reticulibacter mediterranei]|uniref:Uncharacterized protein n=1 Tax=Reticulibacter mediterranei TaxID=2778369 RepID=A0A8J3J338_9CHLR|nr:hypothetical protein [Reticulibacter mediterranei]GHP00667.1 hypothetical protein KSF_107140 [Reticulibacter mediterranei]
MNACNTAIVQARAYWRAQRIESNFLTVEARQTPLPGSVWWVEAHARDTRYDVLVYRLGKGRFQIVPHQPFGYTVYACYKGGETPLAVVEYEVQARETIIKLQHTLLYAQTTLCSVPNPSAVWAEATRNLLAMKQQGKEARRLQHADREEGISQLLRSRIIAQERTSAGEQSRQEAYPQDIFALLEATIRAKQPHSSLHHRAATQAFLAGRMRQGVCQPFGWVWTHSDCLLLIPGDAISQQTLFASRRWTRKQYYFYFDGWILHECLSHEELREVLGFDY